MGGRRVIPTSQAFSAILAHTDTVPVVFSTGYTSRRAAAIEDRPNHFYMLGSMGLASSIAIGVATHRATKHPGEHGGGETWVVDGDASFLMNLSSSLLVPTLTDGRLRHVVLDNGRNASTGGQPSLSSTSDVPALARAFGYQHVSAVDTVTDLREALSRPVTPAGAELIHCLTVDDEPPGHRVELDLPELARRFGDWIKGRPCRS